MKVYQPGRRGKNIVFVQPGAHYPVSDWMQDDGRPKMMAIEFREGASDDLADHLAQYLIDHGLAHRSPIILPDRIAA